MPSMRLAVKRCGPHAVISGCFTLLVQLLTVQASVPLPTGRQDFRGSTAPVEEQSAEQVEEQSMEVEQPELDVLEVVPQCTWIPVPRVAQPLSPATKAATTAARAETEVSAAAVQPDEEAATPAYRPGSEMSGAASNCTLNRTWAEGRVSSDAARTLVKRVLLCWSQRTQQGCAAASSCNWLQDECRCDLDVKTDVMERLLSSMLKQSKLDGNEVSRNCGFAGELRRQVADCEARSRNGSCPANCYDAKAQCVYRSGTCSREKRCSLNSSNFWHDTCGSDVGERCGLTIVDWSWAWPRAGRTSEDVVSCMQRHCPAAAKFYRQLFSVQDHCSALNISECRADSSCFAWDALNSSICEASPQALAPSGCGFGELEAAAWRCNRRNKTTCGGDCQYIEGGTCWRNDLADVCVGSPSKVPLHMSHTPDVCSLSSNAALRVLREAWRGTELRELSRLVEHEALCNNQTSQVDCAYIPAVTGQLQMNVSSPEAFASDASAQDAVAKGIALMASVPRDVVSVRLTVAGQGGKGRGLASDALDDVVGEALRRVSVALDLTGQVYADYAIFVPAGKKAAVVADTLSSTDTAEATAIILKALEENNLGKTYVVEVRHIQASARLPFRNFPVANGALTWAKPTGPLHMLLFAGLLTAFAL